MLHTNRFLVVATMTLALFALTTARAQYPEPSKYPITWELSFDHDLIERIVVKPAGSETGKAYWYLKYTVTNKTDSEQTFLPVFEMLTEDGRVLRSDKNIPPTVFEAIKKREGNKFLIPAIKVGGELRLGEDEAKESVAIWEEPTPEMGRFSVFVQGLSGETATVKSPSGKSAILRKTLQLNYLIRGDEFYPGEDEVNENPETWVMR